MHHHLGPLAFVLALSACGPANEATNTSPSTGDSAAVASAPPTSAPPTSGGAAADEPTPDPITHPCVVAAFNYDQVIAKDERDCKSDADCACYSGGIGEKSGCGGVLGSKAVRELAEIAKNFHEMKCRMSKHCAAWACKPKCEEGKCKQ